MSEYEDLVGPDTPVETPEPEIPVEPEQPAAAPPANEELPQAPPARYAIVSDSTVVNIVLAHAPLADGWVLSESAAIGDSYVDGEFTRPTPAPDPVPQSCTRRQGRLALLQAGQLAAVESAIAAVEDPTERMAAQIEYEADTWSRGNAFLQGMWAQLGGTESELDDLFRVAATL